MKFIRKSNGKHTIEMSRSEWERYGESAGWSNRKKLGKNIGIIVLDGTPKGKNRR
jgi:hypothetical protein